MKTLENNQILIYACAIIIGCIIGLLNVNIGSLFTPLISPLIALLMYVMFAQIPFLNLREVLSNTKFITALLIANTAVIYYPNIITSRISDDFYRGGYFSNC